MIEYGKVVAIVDGKAQIKIQRHAACGDCGACHVGKNQLEMTLLADNDVSAKIGDEVELNIETIDFLSAVLIMYGVPLLALVFGILIGYYGLSSLGFSSNLSQGVGALTGLALMGVSFLIIKSKEKAIKGMKKYRPVIISIRNSNT